MIKIAISNTAFVVSCDMDGPRPANLHIEPLHEPMVDLHAVHITGEKNVQSMLDLLETLGEMLADWEARY